MADGRGPYSGAVSFSVCCEGATALCPLSDSIFSSALTQALEQLAPSWLPSSRLFLCLSTGLGRARSDRGWLLAQGSKSRPHRIKGDWMRIVFPSFAEHYTHRLTSRGQFQLQ